MAQTVNEYQYQRVGDVVNVNAHVDFSAGTVGTGYVAISIPYDPFPYVSKTLGSGEVTDNNAGALRPGALIFPGPLNFGGVNYPTASVNGAVVTQPSPTGRISFGISYRTNDLREVSPYG